ncbi:MAG TPA: LuxR C-terminal-related transcriptional regulator [Gammaproteobacteria bacterium]|nr:LuxR C-terminal-related transcriptional regulator [Gammaproteobacteria bacterium]
MSLELKNHFSLSSSSDVQVICKILETIGITYFNYIKIYNDGSRELLTNNASWIEHFYKNSLYKSVGTIDIEYLLPKGYFLWSELKTDDLIYTHGREFFNIDNGVSFVSKQKNSTTLYIFASTRDNYLINNFYVRNIDLLKRFILFFQDKAAYLMTAAEKNKIYLPEKQIIKNRECKNIILSEMIRQKFFEETTIERFFIPNCETNVYLTKREAECAAYMLDGATAKQIGKLLSISYRTVESHLNQIKEKMNCTSKEKLIDFLLSSNIQDVLIYKERK